MFGVLLLGGGGGAAWWFLQKDKKETSPTPPKVNLSEKEELHKRLQMACLKDPELEGVGITHVESQGGRCLINGVLERPPQQEIVEKKANEIFAQLKKLQTECPQGLDVRPFAVFPVLGEHLPQVAQQIRQSGITPEQKQAVSQARFDKAYYGADGKINFVCTSWSPDKKSQQQIRELIEDYLQGRLAREQKPEVRLEVHEQLNPAVALQKEVLRQQLEGALILPVSYDENMEVQVNAISPPRHEVKVRRILQDSVPTLAAQTGVSKPKIKVNQPKVSLMTKKMLQAKLAQSGEPGKPESRQIKILNLGYTYERTSTGEYGVYPIIKALYLHRRKEKSLEPPADLIYSALDALFTDQQKADAATRTCVLHKPKKNEVERAPSPIYLLQEEIGKNREMDGTVVLNSVFDEEGKLKLVGFLGEAGHKSKLEEMLKDVSQKPQYQPFSADISDADTTRMQPLEWKKKREGLQQTFATGNGLTEEDAPLIFKRTRLDRLWFDYHTDTDDLYLKAEGTCLHGDDTTTAKNKSDQQLKALLTRTFFMGKADQFRLAEKVFPAPMSVLKDVPRTSPMETKEESTRGLGINLEQIAHLENPKVALQNYFSDRKTGGLFILDTYYDASGEFQADVNLDPNAKVEGKPLAELLNDVIQDQKLNLVPKNAYTNPNPSESPDAGADLRLPRPEGQNVTFVSARVADPEDAIGFLRLKKKWNWDEELQRIRLHLFAEEQNDKEDRRLYRQTRIDGAYFKYDKQEKLSLNFEGACLYQHSGGNAPTAPFSVKLATRLKSAFPNGVPEYDPVVAGIVFQKDPIYGFQTTIVKKGLDGVLFQPSTYDETTQLHLVALRPESIAEKDLKAIVEENPFPKGIASLKPGTNEPNFQFQTKPIPWNRQITELHKAHEMSDTLMLRQSRIERLYFDYPEIYADPLLHANGHSIVLVREESFPQQRKILATDLLKRFKDLAPDVKDVDTEQVLYHPNPILALQKKANSLRQYGLFFKDGYFDAEGLLTLSLFLDPDRHQPHAKDLIADYHFDPVLFRKETRLPEGKILPKQEAPVVNEDQKVDWPRFLQMAQEDMANNPPVDEPVRNRGRRLARQTRLDQAYFDWSEEYKPQLKFLGVCLFPKVPYAGPALDIVTGFEFLGVSAFPVRSLQEQRRNLLEKRVPVIRPHKSIAMILNEVGYLNDPCLSLQQLVVNNNPVLEGLLFQEGHYNKDGQLVIEVLISEESQQEDVERLLAVAPPGMLVLGKNQTEPKINYTNMGKGLLRSLLQRELSEGDPYCKTRVLQTVFSYATPPRAPGSTKVIPQLNVTAELIDPLDQTQLEAFLNKVTRDHQVFAKLREKEANIVLHSTVVAESVASLVQREIPKSRAADGARIDDVCFDAEGKLGFRGIWISKEQQLHLEAILKTVDNAWLKKVKNDQISWKRMRIVRSDLVQRRLQTWLFEDSTFEEVLLERLHFNELGNLRVSGFHVHQEDSARLRFQFLERLRKDPLAHELRLTRDPEPMRDIFILDGGLDSLAQHLRDQVPLDPKLDGIRIDRCAYDADAVFNIDGLRDQKKQEEILAEFLDTPRARKRWQRQLLAGWKANEFQTFPIKPMLACLNLVIPDYPELDGIRLDRAYHNPKNELTFDGVMVGRDRNAEVTVLLKRWLDEHPRWRERSRFGVSLSGIQISSRDKDLAFTALSEALQLLRSRYPEETDWGLLCLHDPSDKENKPKDPLATKRVNQAVEFLSTSLLHNPESSTAWFLRAACFTVLEQDLAAERDLRRAARVDGLFPLRQQERFAFLEYFQGQLRAQLEKDIRVALLEVIRGKKLKLTDCH